MSSRKVLLIEDEEAVRLVISRFLEKSGYEVVFPTDEEPFGSPACGAAVIDLTLPGISGLELAERFLARNPSARVILMSGLPGGEEFADRWGPNVVFLQKPFSPAVLIETLEIET